MFPQNGYIIRWFLAESGIEVWEIDNRASEDVCDWIADGAEAWATGSASVSVRDFQDPNTIGTFVSKETGQADLTSSDGDFRYSWTILHTTDSAGENTVESEHWNLSKQEH